MPPSEPFLAAPCGPERRTSEQLLEALQSVSTNKSQTNLKKLHSHFLEYAKFLPGPLTPQKFTGNDVDYQLDLISYSRVLESLVDLFDINWPLMNGIVDEDVLNIFVVDGAGSQILNESLLILTQAMKKAVDLRISQCFGVILEKLVKSDALLSAIVFSCRATENNEFEKNIEEEIWQNIIQIIISLPNRVANKMEKNLLESFKLKNFTNIIIFHVARAIDFLNHGHDVLKIKVEHKIISMLLSKMFLVLNSVDLIPLIDIFIEWSISNQNNISNMLQQILLHVDSRSRENLAVQFLKHDKFIPKVFGNLTKDANWRLTLTTRIPLMSWYENDNLMRNLVSYLSYAQNSEDKLLVELVIKMLDVWGDRSVLNHTSFEQHLYITKLIILSIKSMKNCLSLSERNEIQKLVFSGIPAHLGSTEVDIRAVGMITGEILTDLLLNVGNVEKLKFEYDGLTERALNIVESLKSIELPKNSMDVDDNENLTLGEIEFPNKGNKRLYELGVEAKILKNITKLEEIRVSKDESKTIKASVIKEESQNKITEISMDENEELDSDDDLVPYDMSNDTKQIEKLKPLYLRDLRDNLVQTAAKGEDDPDIFSETIRVSEELILAQLGNDDPSFACELLEIFMNLQERSTVDDFEVQTFKACVAIVTTHPKETAEYICKEFHTELSKYSVQQRLLMLNILCEAATRLSAIKFEEKVEELQVPVKKKKLDKPISLFIETDKSKKYQTLYDDDFDDPTNPESSQIDWRDVVQQRIVSKTRHFAHKTRLPKTTINKFGKVVSSFFYPLIYGFGSSKQCFLYDFPKSYKDHQSILLTRFLETLATIMTAAQNCSIVTKMAKEILELVWTLKYHEEGKVRLAVIKCVASVLISVPEFDVKGDLLGGIMEIREWLMDASQNTMKGDPDKDCREFGRHVLYLLDSVLQGLVQTT